MNDELRRLQARMVTEPLRTMPTYERILIERDSLKAECIRLMDEVRSLKGQVGREEQLRSALRAAEEDLRGYQEKYACAKRLACGGLCRLGLGHDDACLCVGDTEGPGSCPA